MEFILAYTIFPLLCFRLGIAIARALYTDSKLLLLDEATSALDSHNEMMIQEAINKFIEKGDRSVIVIAHRMKTVKNAQKILFIDNGNLYKTILLYCFFLYVFEFKQVYFFC